MRAYNPKPTLKANFDAGEGEIGNLDEFRKHDTLMRLDLLKDWIYDLEQEYNKTFDEHQNKRERRRLHHGQG